MTEKKNSSGDEIQLLIQQMEQDMPELKKALDEIQITLSSSLRQPPSPNRHFWNVSGIGL